MRQTIRRAKPSHAATAATFAAIAAASVMPATASEIQDAYRAHTGYCLGLFFSDKPAHDVQCLPNTMANIPAHEASGGAVVAPPPPPVVEPDPDVESSYPDLLG